MARPVIGKGKGNATKRKSGDKSNHENSAHSSGTTVNGETSQQPESESQVSDNIEQSLRSPSKSTTDIVDDGESERYDKWISELSEFKETKISTLQKDMSVAEALFKLEAAKDMPAISLGKFNGDPMQYVDFMESSISMKNLI